MEQTSTKKNAFGGDLDIFDFCNQINAATIALVNGYFVMTWDKDAVMRFLPGADKTNVGEGFAYIYFKDGVIIDARIGDQTVSSAETAVRDFSNLLRIAYKLKATDYFATRMDFYVSEVDVPINLNYTSNLRHNCINLVTLLGEIETISEKEKACV
jgi:hypothetical protein